MNLLPAQSRPEDHSNPRPVDSQFRARLWWAALPVAWIAYRLTMAPGVLWGDAGHAQIHTALDGWMVEGQIARSHVLYFMFARALHRFLDFDAAFSANLISTIGGAFTVANVGYLCATLCRTRLAAVAGAILILFAHTHWRLSVSAEVVTLTTALLSAELICVMRLIETGRSQWLVPAMLFNGLGVANHNFAMLMWPVYAVLAVRFRGNIRSGHVRALLLGWIAWLAGAAPLLALCYLDWREQGSLGATIRSLLLGTYSDRVTNLGRLPRLFVQTLVYALLNFPTPLLLLVPVGVATLWRSARPAGTWLLLLAFAVYLLFGMRYDVADQYTFLVPAFLFLPMFVALGADALLMRRSSLIIRWLLIVCAGLAPLVYAAAPPVLRRSNLAAAFLPQREVPHRDRFDWFLRPWLTGYDGAERFARETLEALPPWAILAVDSTLAAPINYLQVTEKVRKDVRLDCWAAQQSWLGRVDGDAERQSALRDGRLYATTDDAKYQTPWLREGKYTLQRDGFLFKVGR